MLHSQIGIFRFVSRQTLSTRGRRNLVAKRWRVSFSVWHASTADCGRRCARLSGRQTARICSAFAFQLREWTNYFDDFQFIGIAFNGNASNGRHWKASANILGTLLSLRMAKLQTEKAEQNRTEWKRNPR